MAQTILKPISPYCGAGDHDAAVDLELGLGEIEHRRRPDADPDNVYAGRAQPFDQPPLEGGRALAPVAADGDAGAAGAAHDRAEAAADRLGVVLAQRRADDRVGLLAQEAG